MARAAGTLLLLMHLSLGSGLQVEDTSDPEMAPAAFLAKVTDQSYWPSTGSAAGDPKLQGLYGRRFQIHRPGDYTLMTVPNLRKKHGTFVEMEVEVKELDVGDPCLLFMKKATLSGTWLGSQKVQIRAQGAGGDFALKLDRGPWRSFQNLTGVEEAIHKDESSGVITTVKGVVGKREGHMDDINGPFEHRFLFRLGKERQKEKKLTIDIAMPRPGREYLTVKVEHIKGLGEIYWLNLHGLLAADPRTDSHPDLQMREECKVSANKTKASELLALSGGLSYASAHWD